MTWLRLVRARLPTLERAAAIGYLVPVASIGGVWYLLLFAGHEPTTDYGVMLHGWFFEAPERWIFWMLVILPGTCLTLAILYLSPLAAKSTAAIVLAAVGLATAIGAWLAIDTSIAVFVTLPLVFSVPKAWLVATRSRRSAA
jgi:hypothetical protein